MCNTHIPSQSNCETHGAFFYSSIPWSQSTSCGHRCKVRKRWLCNCDRWYGVLGILFKTLPYTPWLYSCPIPDESLPSYAGLWLGLTKLMTQWICQNSAHNGHLQNHEYLVFHSQILHIYQNSGAHRELFIWIVCSTMLWVAWLAPGKCMSLLWFSFGVLPTTDTYNTRGWARLYSPSSKAAWITAWIAQSIFFKGGSFPCHSVSGLDIPKCEYAASRTCRSLPDTIFTSSGGSMRCDHLPLF